MPIWKLTFAALALALAVAACSDGASSREAAPSAAAPSSEAPATAPDSAQSETAPEGAGEVPVVPHGDVPTIDPLPSTKPTPPPEPVDGAFTASTRGPPLEQMTLARPAGKVGPPVDVRYTVSGVVAKGQPVTLQLAFVPRLAGTNLRVEFPESAGITIESGANVLSSQKASQSDVLRHSLLVTPNAADSGEVRTIVSIDIGEARYAGLVTIPLGTQGIKTASKKVPQG